MGSSLISRASAHSRIRPLGKDLGLQYFQSTLIWIGMSGMSVYDVVPLLSSMINCYGIPQALLIHCGGNDIGLTSCAKLLFDIKFMLYVVSNMMPNTKLFFSSILPRITWRYSNNNKAMHDTRKRLNRGVKHI